MELTAFKETIITIVATAALVIAAARVLLMELGDLVRSARRIRATSMTIEKPDGTRIRIEVDPTQEDSVRKFLAQMSDSPSEDNRAGR